MANDCRLVLLWQWIALFIAVFSSLQLSRFSHCKLSLMEFGSHNQYLDTSFGGPYIHIVGIQLSLGSKPWELSPLWVSEVHGCTGVAGFYTESAEQNLPLEFLAPALLLLWQSPHLQKLYQNVRALVKTHHFITIKFSGVTSLPSLCIYA